MGEKITSEEIKDKHEMIEYLYTFICKYVEKIRVKEHLTVSSKNDGAVHFMHEHNYLSFITFSLKDNDIRVLMNFNDKKEVKYNLKLQTTSWLLIREDILQSYVDLTDNEIDNLFEEFLSEIKS